MPSGNLNKYEYLTGEDLNHKPDAVEQAKLYYFTLNKFFNRGLKKEKDKKEGLLKRLKNIEDKNEVPLKIIRYKTDINSYVNVFDEHITREVAALIKEIKSIEDNVDYSKLSFVGGNKNLYGFKNFKTFEKLIKDLHNRNMTTDEVETNQSVFVVNLHKLRAYPTRGSKYIDLKESVFRNAKNFLWQTSKIVYEFKNVKLSLSKKEDMKTDSSDQQPDTSDTPKQTKFNDFLKLIKEEQTNIDMRLFKKYFPYRTPDKMAQVLYNSKSKAGNHSEVNLIFSGFDHIS